MDDNYSFLVQRLKMGTLLMRSEFTTFAWTYHRKVYVGHQCNIWWGRQRSPWFKASTHWLVAQCLQLHLNEPLDLSYQREATGSGKKLSEGKIIYCLFKIYLLFFGYQFIFPAMTFITFNIMGTDHNKRSLYTNQVQWKCN